MASSSTVSPSTNHTRYDVFISFNEDTRFSFTDHLYEALIGAGIRTYRDNSFNNSTDRTLELERAITLSRTSIVVLSKNYVVDSSCLDELRLIMERRKGFYHVVVPVFYHVDPVELRKEDSVCKLEVFRKAEWAEQWKVALMEVAHLSDKAVSRPETKFIADIVNTIGNKLGLKLVSSPPHLTGMDTRAEDINLWMKDKQDTQVLTICGPAGSGKTTLAKYIYDTNLLKFESSSFLEDIGKICEQTCGLCALQEQLLSDILEDKRKELDVNSYKELNAWLVPVVYENCRFGPNGSLITHLVPVVAIFALGWSL